MQEDEGFFVMREHTFTPHQGSVSFRPHARLIRLLGDELISDEVVAVVELVKNGYDADATHIHVALQNIKKPEPGWIYIKDNGSGMDLHTLLNVWMEPATSHKRQSKRQKIRTHRGRIQSGEKGIGRFAVDKLGADLELVTRTTGADYEIVLNVNWNSFEDNRYLEDVKSTWYTREPTEFIGDEHGTLLKIHSLRSTWNNEMMEKLYNGLIRLLSPFSDISDFTVELYCPEYPSISGKLTNRILDSAPYKLSGYIDRNGIFHSDTSIMEVIDLKPLCHNHFMLPSGDIRDPFCGPFKISLSLWDLELQPGKGLGVDRTLREMIKSSSGVSIYRDNFRIWPYGEKDDDWLELNQRRVNNPTLRISNNQIIGFIEITHADNPDLKDRTSREGLIDTPAFFDLKYLTLALISELEVLRFNQRHQAVIVESHLMDEESDELFQYLSKLHQSQKPGTTGTVKVIEKLYRQRIEREQGHYRRISTMAGLGLVAEVLSDSFSREIDSVRILLRILQGEVYGEGLHLRDLIKDLSMHIRVINEQLDLLDPLYHPYKQTNEPVHIKGLAYDVISAMRHKLAETNTSASITGEQRLTVRMGRGHLMIAIMILVDNALKTMKESCTQHPAIDINVRYNEDNCSLFITDNGPGVEEKYRKLIFEPAFTLRKTGRGMGLHIARDILASYNATLKLSEQQPEYGASFEIRLDRRRIVK